MNICFQLQFERPMNGDTFVAIKGLPFPGLAGTPISELERIAERNRVNGHFCSRNSEYPNVHKRKMAIQMILLKKKNSTMSNTISERQSVLHPQKNQARTCVITCHHKIILKISNCHQRMRLPVSPPRLSGDDNQWH